MLISSSRCPSLYRTSFKEAHSSDKAATQRSKIYSQQLIGKPLMKERICHIQKELMRLDDNPALLNYLAHSHYLFFNRSPYVPSYGSHRCQDSVFAITQRNLFDHKRFREIDSLESCALELLNKEEGTFSVRISQRIFVADSGETRVFQGHSFIIIKMIEGDNTSYLIAQSFVEKYSLKNFILKNEMIYDSFYQLNEKVLEPLKLIVNKSGEWSDEECRAHFELTGVFPGWLIGFSPPNHNLLEATSFGRSTNFQIEGKKSMSLGKFVNGELEIPDEWKQIMKEYRE